MAITITVHLHPQGSGARAALHTLERYLGMCNDLQMPSNQLQARFNPYALDNPSVQSALRWIAGDFVQDGHLVDVTDGYTVQRATQATL